MPTQDENQYATELPSHAFQVLSRSWPQEGNLIQQDGDEAAIGPEIVDLAPGDYLILGDKETRAASYFSVETGDGGALVRPVKGEFRPEQFAFNQGASLLGSEEPAGFWRLYDLRTPSSWALGPTCRGAWNGWLSPDGDWIGSICHDSFQFESANYDHIVLEFLSTATGTGMHFAIPTLASDRDQPSLVWIGNGNALVSRVWVDEEQRACAVSIEQAMMYCPPLGLDAMLPSGTHTSPRSDLIPFIGFEDPPRAALVPRECFEIDAQCEGVIELAVEETRRLIATPDPEIVWWIEPLGPDPTTEVGLVDLGTGSLRQIASLGGDYSDRAFCPDGSCMFMFHYDSEMNWRLNLDGSLQVMPFQGDVIIGSFHVP